MKNALCNTETVLATTLPDSVRIPLDSLWADSEYLIGRVIADGSCGSMVVRSMRDRLDQIKAAIMAIPTGDLFNELVRRIDFDGADPRTFTLSEIERAVPGATFPNGEFK